MDMKDWRVQRTQNLVGQVSEPDNVTECGPLFGLSEKILIFAVQKLISIWLNLKSSMKLLL